MRTARTLLSAALAVLMLFGLCSCDTGREDAEPAALPELDEDYVSIQVDGREVRRVPLSQPQTVTIDQGSGVVNVVEITSRGAVMKTSTCDNQLCVHMGKVTLENWEYRPNGAFIICLPNRVSVELIADP